MTHYSIQTYRLNICKRLWTKEVIQKRPQRTGDIICNKIADKFAKNSSQNSSGTDLQSEEKLIGIPEKDIYIKKDSKLLMNKINVKM